MEMIPARRPDPRLEELRNSVEAKEDVHQIAAELQELTSQIHAEYLFEKEGFQTLRKLCLFIGADSTGKASTDWCDFADHLRLSYEQIKNIEKFFQKEQGPVWCILRAYAQWEDATIKEVIQSVYELERYDVISVINEETREFVKSLCDRIDPEKLLRRPGKLWVPLTLYPLDVPKITNDTSMSLKGTESNRGEMVYGPKQRSAWAAKVLLTFANDGKECAQRIAEVFRSHEPKIGVLILEEHPSKMSSHALKFIDSMLRVVDNIIPILSRGYFNKINNTSTEAELESSTAYDDRFVEYIYRSVQIEYIQNNCTSKRVRSILPHGMMARDLPNRSPSLESWYSEAEISKFIKLLLIEKKNASRAKKMMKCNES